MRYVIGSGWWATDDSPPKRRKKGGDDLIRSAAFHRVWYESLCRFTNPDKIILVDSASPVPPPLNEGDDRIEFVSLDRNYGHPTTCDSQLSGWSRSA